MTTVVGVYRRLNDVVAKTLADQELEILAPAFAQRRRMDSFVRRGAGGLVYVTDDVLWVWSY